MASDFIIFCLKFNFEPRRNKKSWLAFPNCCRILIFTYFHLKSRLLLSPLPHSSNTANWVSSTFALTHFQPPVTYIPNHGSTVQFKLHLTRCATKRQIGTTTVATATAAPPPTQSLWRSWSPVHNSNSCRLWLLASPVGTIVYQLNEGTYQIVGPYFLIDVLSWSKNQRLSIPGKVVKYLLMRFGVVWWTFLPSFYATKEINR